MYIKKIILSILITIFIGGCSNLAFNERYNNASWDKVLIAPFSGDLTTIAEDEFEHALAISSKLIVIPASTVKNLLKDEELESLYKTNPNKAMFDLADKLHANGVVFVKINAFSPKARHSSDLVSSTVSLNAKLVDINSGSIVASSQHNSSSIFSSTSKLIHDVSQNAIDDFNKFFDKLNRR
jgi:Na+-translocating ferredoxin:NAD+ oxidoreductase RnfC subunit